MDKKQKQGREPEKRKARGQNKEDPTPSLTKDLDQAGADPNLGKERERTKCATYERRQSVSLYIFLEKTSIKELKLEKAVHEKVCSMV